VLRLLQLQVFEHDKYKRLAHNNTTRRSLARAPRGIIYDRHGKILVTSKQSLSVVIYPAILKNESDLVGFSRKLSKYIDLDEQELLEMLKKIDPSTPLPITLDNDVDIKTAIKIHENESLLPGEIGRAHV
jgi:cell division protein FtsI/penicillin-binding protein 2